MIASYGQYSAHGVATATIEFATRAGKIVKTSDKCYVYSKRTLFPHKDPCHVSCSTHINYLCPKYINFPALVATSIVAIPRWKIKCKCIYLAKGRGVK